MLRHLQSTNTGNCLKQISSFHCYSSAGMLYHVYAVDALNVDVLMNSCIYTNDTLCHHAEGEKGAISCGFSVEEWVKSKKQFL